MVKSAFIPFFFNKCRKKEVTWLSQIHPPTHWLSEKCPDVLAAKADWFLVFFLVFLKLKIHIRLQFFI